MKAYQSTPYHITPVTFTSGGEICRGKFYISSQGQAVPCVVLANGFSGTMDWILPPFADKFASAGFAALIFDYRHLGESEGEPRQLIDIDKQRTDLRNAIAFAKQYQGVDSKKICLWGTSLGGSHVITIAAEDSSIAAVIANMPGIDAIKGGNVKLKMKAAKASYWDVITSTFKVTYAAVVDSIRSRLGYSPYYLKVYGKPGRAIFTDPSLASRFKTVAEQSPTWKNQVAARFLFKCHAIRKER